MAPSESLARLKRRLATIPKVAKDEIRKGLDASADEIVANAKRLAPKKTGKLASTIRKEAGEHDLQVVITAGGPETTKPVRDGADATYDYALAAEFGTVDTPAQSFFYPSYRLAKKRVKARLSRAVSKAAKTAAGGPR